MTFPQFNKRLIIVTLGLIAISFILSWLEPFQNTLGFSIATTLFFAGFTIGLFYLGTSTANSPNKNLFMGVAIGSIFLKLVLTILILYSYKVIFEPEGGNHVFLFLIIYLVYTVFETSVLMKLSKPKD